MAMTKCLVAMDTDNDLYASVEAARFDAMGPGPSAMCAHVGAKPATGQTASRRATTNSSLLEMTRTNQPIRRQFLQGTTLGFSANGNVTLALALAKDKGKSMNKSHMTTHRQRS